jgi:N-acetyl-anhydromuramyl-L-alanine amidase AmpD
MNMIERPLHAGSQSNNPNLIVIHAMAEYIKDPEPIFAPDFLENYGLSAHALIQPDGDILICRSSRTGAYHARGYNRNSIGIEYLVEGEHDYGSFVETIKTDYITPAQWNAGIELAVYYRDMFGIENIKRHSDLSPGRKVDPGSGFDWKRFTTAINLDV